MQNDQSTIIEENVGKMTQSTLDDVYLNDNDVVLEI